MTGVQTCALPICIQGPTGGASGPQGAAGATGPGNAALDTCNTFKVGTTLTNNTTGHDNIAIAQGALKCNITGNLTAKIVNDSSGLPDLSSVVAVANPVNMSSISSAAYGRWYLVLLRLRH